SVVWKTILRRGEAVSSGQGVNETARRREPEIAGAVTANRVAVLDSGGLARVDDEAIRFQLADGPFAADHDVAVSILGDRRDEAFRHAVGGGVDAELATRETRHDAVARGPDASVARFEQRARVIAHQTVRR